MPAGNSWVFCDGEHINLATASSVAEVGPQGTDGYLVRHGDRTTDVTGPPELLTQIRFYLYKHKLPAVA